MRQEPKITIIISKHEALDSVTIAQSIRSYAMVEIILKMFEVFVGLLDS